jgi:glycosyltransferase involved in cell wall biosynthesis
MPTVSVILPVYNAATFLRSAIDSVLAQTFNDFELLIINDGSTDDSENIILSYTDKRIRYFRNEKNRGLIYTLNKAIEQAAGNYIARMDADDVCYTNRLQEQKDWLDSHPSTAVVASFSDEINGDGDSRGYFEPDRLVVTAAQIRRKMPEINCITHPSVMARAEILKSYRYNALQKNIEDYDLWLRILADGGVIEKIPKPLLQYRVHQTSVTQSKLRRKNFFWKHVACKKRFLTQQIKNRKLNRFVLSVAAHLGLDLLKAVGKDLKRMRSKK